MLITCAPAGSRSITASAARAPQIVASRFTSTIRRTSSSVWVQTFSVFKTPALLTHTLSGPRSLAAAATLRCEAGSRTSCAIDQAPPPICSAVSAAPASFRSVTSTS